MKNTFYADIHTHTHTHTHTHILEYSTTSTLQVKLPTCINTSCHTLMTIANWKHCIHSRVHTDTYSYHIIKCFTIIFLPALSIC